MVFQYLDNRIRLAPISTFHPDLMSLVISTESRAAWEFVNESVSGTAENSGAISGAKSMSNVSSFGSASFGFNANSRMPSASRSSQGHRSFSLYGSLISKRICEVSSIAVSIVIVSCAESVVSSTRKAVRITTSIAKLKSPTIISSDSPVHAHLFARVLPCECLPNVWGSTFDQLLHSMDGIEIGRSKYGIRD